MADDKFIASLGGIEFEAMDLGDTLPNAIVRHEFANKDGALLEHMGQRARMVHIRAFFLNEEYDSHNDLIALMANTDTYELIHPKYGVLVGYAEEIAIRHDDRQLTAEIDISFLEDLIGSTETVMIDVPEVDAAVAGSFLSGLDSHLKTLSQDLQNDMLTFKNVVDLAKYTTQISSCISSVEGMLTTITNPANSLLSTIAFATDTPGTMLGAISNVVERYSLLYDNLKSAPTRFVASFRNGMAQLRSSFGASSSPAKQAAIDTFIKHLTISGSLQLSLDLAECYQADELARMGWKRGENIKSFDTAGNYLNPILPDPIMTVNDIEQSLADTRTEIQMAVDQAREIRELQDAAASLVAHVDKVKINYDTIETVTIENTLPLHLICFQYGLPYQAAERVQAINNFNNPNFVSGDMKIYVQ